MVNPDLIKNKLMGVACLTLSIFGTLWFRDATAFLIFFILGIGLLFAKENYIS